MVRFSYLKILHCLLFFLYTIMNHAMDHTAPESPSTAVVTDKSSKQYRNIMLTVTNVEPLLPGFSFTHAVSVHCTKDGTYRLYGFTSEELRLVETFKYDQKEVFDTFEKVYCDLALEQHMS